MARWKGVYVIITSTHPVQFWMYSPVLKTDIGAVDASRLAALSYAPSMQAENTLKELVKRDERFLNEYEWVAALSKRNTLMTARILLDSVCSASFSDKHGSYDSIDFVNRLSAFMNFHEQFRQEVYERVQNVGAGPARSILEGAIANAADANGVLLLIRVSASQGKEFRSTPLYTALRHVLIGRTTDPSAMQQLYSLPATELRKGVFDMVVNGTPSE